MADIKYPVITIGRLYGAGGRSVASRVASELDIPWYDNDFVKKAASMSGIAPEDFERDGEQVSKLTRFWESMMPAAYNRETDMIQEAQEKAILELAKSPCILIGRCANVVLREAGVKNLSVFLYADENVRAARAAEIAKAPNMDFKTYIARRDNKRATYYKIYTGYEHSDPRNYNICLDTGLLGYDKCAQIIVDLAKGMAE